MSDLIRLKNLPFNRGYFWSYDWENGSLPLSVIVEQILIYGELDDIFNLFKLFGAERVKNVYYSKIRNKLIEKNKSFVKIIDKIIKIRYNI